MTTMISSRKFNQDAGGAKRAASEGLVFITDRGRPSYVLMTIEEFQRISGAEGLSIVDRLAFDGDPDIDFDPPRIRDLGRTVELD